MPYHVQLQTLSEGYDRQTNWFQPRVAVAPPTIAVLTMTSMQLWGSDIFTAVHAMWSDDLGRTWSAPRPVAGLDRRAMPGGFEACPCDMTPVWHAGSGRLLATGHTAIYMPGDARDPFNLELTERRGANGRVYLCRVKCGNGPGAGCQEYPKNYPRKSARNTKRSVIDGSIDGGHL